MQLLEPVVPGKTALPILHNVLLKDGRAIAGDLETFVFIDLPEADIECLIPHNSVMELLKYVPGNETLTIEADGELTLSWEGGKSSYPRAKSEEYPPEPELVVKIEGTLDGNVLVKALASAANYCSNDTSRPVLNGVAIFPGENLDIAAGDGFRMAYQTIPATFPIEEPLIIPSTAVWVLSSLWQHTKPDVTLGDSLVKLVTNKRQMDVALVEAKGSGAALLRVCFSGVTALIKLIQGTPPNFKQLIPKDIPTTVKFFPGDLERAVKRLRAIATEGKGIVRLSWTQDTMTVSASDEEAGKVEGTLPVQADNPDRVAIDIKYLLEYLKGKEGIITLGLTSGTAPVVLRHRNSPLVLVMPMMVQW
jgi:DNA polymerase III sliding clamp (beta) subunit (PCNA family)